MTTQDRAPLKRSKRDYLITGILITAAVALITVLGVGLTLDQKEIPSSQINEPAKSFRASWIHGREYLPEVAGDSFSLKDLKGKPVVLNFWASWCISCRQEAHELEKFWQAHKGEVLVVGVAIQDTPSAARQFADHYGKSYVLGLDENGKVSINYGVSGVPETFLIDENGIIRHKEIGPVTKPMLEKLLPKITPENS